MKWTSQEFDSQPWQFIDAILTIFKERSRAAERAAYKASLHTRP